jgi:hypothetical protein
MVIRSLYRLILQSGGGGYGILIDAANNVTCTGQISNGSNSYIYAGGLRLGGFDTGNTIWQNTRNLGISANTGNNIIFYIGNGSERMRINSAGDVGIGITNPNCKLYINTNAGNGVNSFGLRIGSGGGTDGANFFCGIGLSHEANGWSKSAIGHVRMGPYDTGDLVFLTNNSWDSSDYNMSHERMRITRGGRIGVANTNPQSMLHLGNCEVPGSAPVIVFGP